MWQKCFYKTLDLAPTATDHEIRSAYRRCALTTHPDKGGSAEAFRAVVHAFETLIDVTRREAYDHLRRCPNKSSFAAGSVKKEVRPPKKRHGESNAEPANLAKSAKDKPKPAPAAPDGPRKKAKRPPPPATEPNSKMDCDPVGHADLFCLLLRLPKKQALKELEKLTEEALNAFAEFLESHEAEEILLKLSVSRPCKLRMLALKDVPKTTARMNSDTPTVPAAPRLAKPRLKGISCNSPDGRYRTYIVLFPCFMTKVQSVKNLDTAIDMHISLVQMRQCVHAGLVEGKDFRQVLRGAIDTIQKERTAAGAEELRLRFQSYVRSGPDKRLRFTPTNHDLDKAIQDWTEVTGLTEPSRAGVSAPAKEKAGMLPSRKEEMAARQKRLPSARVQHGRLKATVWTLQARFQKVRRQKLLGTWGVPELPEGLQLNSFQSPDDSLCATLRLSDGTEAVGPYRKNFQQALQELQELRALQQRKGDQALQKEMQRRDVEAMTAFFVDSISWDSGVTELEWFGADPAPRPQGSNVWKRSKVEMYMTR